MPDQYAYANSLSFIVNFNNEEEIGFAKISNIEAKIDYEVIHEGGNPIPILLPVARKDFDTITMERGVALNRSRKLWSQLKPGVRVSNVSITVMQQDKAVRKLRFEEGIVIAKEYPQLDALSSSVYIEKLQIAHSGLIE